MPRLSNKQNSQAVALTAQRLTQRALSGVSARFAEAAYAALSLAGLGALVSHDLVHPALMYCLQLFLAL